MVDKEDENVEQEQSSEDEEEVNIEEGEKYSGGPIPPASAPEQSKK